MHLDLADEETFALLNLLVETIEADRYPYSRRIQVLRGILAKFGEPRPTTAATSQTAEKMAVKNCLSEIG